MPKKTDYAQLFTHRKDGRWQKVVNGKTLIDKDPELLLQRVEEANNPPPPEPPEFKEIADAWQDEHWEQIGYKTREAYTAPLRRINSHFGRKAIPEITAAQVQAYISEVAKEGYARRTVQMSLDILRMIFNKAILLGAISANPCDAVSVPRGLRTTRRELPDDEAVNRVKQSVDAPFGLFALICLYTGARRGEALALNYEDIDRSAKVVHICKAVEFEGNAPILKSTKTESGIRDVVLLDALAEHIPEGNGLIFCDETGGLLTKTQYRRRWQKYLNATGLNITAHQLRHGYATLLYEAGIADKDAQELLGHSNISVTRNVYTHIRQSRRQETADKLNAFVSKSVSESV